MYGSLAVDYRTKFNVGDFKHHPRNIWNSWIEMTKMVQNLTKYGISLTGHNCPAITQQ